VAVLAVNVPNPGIYMSQLGQHLVNLRNALNDLVQDAEYLQAMGGTAFLEAAPFNLTPADATLIMNTVGQATSTNAVVLSIDQFLASAITLTGGG
jgi:hypothetical protein